VPLALPARARQKWKAGTGAALWKDLLAEAPVAFPAAWRLAASEQGIALLKGRLKPDAHADPKEVARLIARLDDDEFSVRQEATKQLARLGAGAGAALERALANSPSQEVKRRIKRLLARLEATESSPQGRRDLRAIHALELMRPVPAKGLLEALARGAPAGVRTRAARAALLRLEAQRRREKSAVPRTRRSAR
jgi:hypothetical protein